jgi:formylglycine-generating enzyme required for sulfatase activity
MHWTTLAEYVVEYRLPYPVAYRFKRAHVARNPLESFGFYAAAGEELLRLLAGLSFAAVAASGLEIGDEWIRELERPTLGKWLAICGHNSARAVEVTSDNAITQLMRRMADRSKTTPMAALRRFVELRNNFIHGSDQSENRATELFPELRSSLLSAISGLDELTQFQAIACEEVSRRPLRQDYNVTVRFCDGCTPFFDYREWQMTVPLEPGLLYLMDDNAALAYPIFPSYRVGSPKGYVSIDFFGYHGNRDGKHRWLIPKSGQSTRSSDSDTLTSEVPQFEQLCVAFPVPPRQSTSMRIMDEVPTLSGYTTVGPIGSGRLGFTYLVHNNDLQERRVLKVQRPEHNTDPRERERFEREAALLESLSHVRSVVDTYGSGLLANRIPYLLTEYVEGGSLEDMIEPGVPLEWRLLRQIALSALRGLDEIHREGVIHRDIKLGNLLWDGRDVRYSDFDVARRGADGRLTLAGELVGSLGYIAPELPAIGATRQSDIYALGVTLSYLLVGGETPDPRPAIRKARIPAIARDALLFMTERLPENRPATCAAPFARLAATSNIEPPDEWSVPSSRIVRSVQSASAWRSKVGDFFRWIPSGTFLMGATRYRDERPVHEVQITRPFLIAQSTVTNQQFTTFCSETGYRGRHRNFLLHMHHPGFSEDWRHPDSPVVFVSYLDAQEYALWRAESEGLEFALPTEAEWEYVARAGSRTAYPWGQVIDPKRLNCDKRIGHPVPNGRYLPNAWGISDMLGNVWEWCRDYKDVATNRESVFYRLCAETADGLVDDPCNDGPGYLRDRAAPADSKVIRGGSWASKGRNLRPANRRGQFLRDAIRSCGFRLIVRDVPSKEIIELGPGDADLRAIDD